jgi:hypothetical protein
MTRAGHVSVCPISMVDSEGFGSDVTLPLKISESLFFDDVSEIIRETNFDWLEPVFPNKSERDALKRVRYGLVRQIECADGEPNLEDEKSARMLYCLYLGLKVIRPTPSRFQIFHYDLAQSDRGSPRIDRNDYATIVCDCDRLNWIRWMDLQQLAAVGPVLLSVLANGTLPISQAVQSLEIGYRADFLHVRHLLWVVGLDALFTSREWESQGAKISAERILNFLGSDFQIYSEDHSRELGLPRPTSPSFDATIRDIYKLRNHFAHGAWPDKRWAGRICRRSTDFCRDIYYSELLSEAAASILRACLKKIWAEEPLVELFNDKNKMNAYFASHGLIRTRKTGCGKEN